MALRRPGIIIKGGTPELQASTSITENSLMQAIADNPVSMASYSRMQQAGGTLQFNFDLSTKFNAIGQANPVTRLIELDPAGIEAEANAFGYDPSEYAARIFSHEADHLTDMSRAFGKTPNILNAKLIKLSAYFKNGARPSFDTRSSIWNQVMKDYPNLPTGKNPFSK